MKIIQEFINAYKLAINEIKEGLLELKDELMAGILIAISCAVYLKTSNPILFSFGLLAIIHMKLNLFTGKICISNKNWFKNLTGNILGATIVGILLKSSPEFEELAIKACTRFEKHWLMLFILAILCNICIGVAVKTNALITIFAVTVFVACGFEHCIADVFYMATAGIFNIKIIAIILGNIVGGFIMRNY